MRRFTVHVAVGGQPLPAEHPSPDQTRKLAKILAGLPHDHGFAYCQGCLWFARRPVRLDDLGLVAYQHLTSAHFDAIVDGRACVDPDLVDGGAEHLAARLRAVPERLRPVFEAAS